MKLHETLAGALAGAAATLPMTLAMSALNGAPPWSPRRPLPPRRITGRLARRAAGSRPPEPLLRAATVAAHFGYGGLCGAAYPAFARRAGGGALGGAAFGAAVWAVSYFGWVPAARLMAGAHRQPPRLNAIMFSAHLVWGAALSVGRRLAMRSEGPLREKSTD